MLTKNDRKRIVLLSLSTIVTAMMFTVMVYMHDASEWYALPVAIFLWLVIIVIYGWGIRSFLNDDGLVGSQASESDLGKDAVSPTFSDSGLLSDGEIPAENGTKSREYSSNETTIGGKNE